jgi:hypothetical protein
VEDFYQLTISPSSELDCSLLNGVSPYLLLLGFGTIIFAVIYLSFHFTNGQYDNIKLMYKVLREERISSTTKKNYVILTLIEVVWTLWGPIAIVGVIRGLGIFLAWNALISVYTLFQSGCF